MEDLSLHINEVALANITRLSEEYSVLAEQRVLEIFDIASDAAKLSVKLLNEGFSAYEAMSVISEGLEFGKYSSHAELLEEHQRYILSALSALGDIDKAVFSDIYSKMLAGHTAKFNESAFFEKGQSKESFVYVKNPLADEAFDVFSQEFSDPRVRYLGSFKDCAAAVAAGEFGYCLLPIEERGGTRLHGIAELIHLNDLRIRSVTPVFGALGDMDLKYALVSRELYLPSRQAGDDRYLELRLGADKSGELSRLLSAVLHFGMSIYRVNTMSFSTDTEQNAFYSVVVRDEERDFCPFLTYLSLFVRDYVIVGIYKNLE